MPEYDIREFDADLSIRKNEEVGVFTIGIGGSISTSPVIVGDRMFFGAMDTMFYCLDAKTGEKIWDFKTGGIINSFPAFYI